MTPRHAALSRECTRDLRAYRAHQAHRRARAPILSKMQELRAALRLPPLTLLDASTTPARKA